MRAPEKGSSFLWKLTFFVKMYNENYIFNFCIFHLDESVVKPFKSFHLNIPNYYRH